MPSSLQHTIISLLHFACFELKLWVSKLIIFRSFVGECRLENMRTLCVACHSDVTRSQCAERRSTRSKAKKQLKAIMSAIKNKGTEIDLKVCSESSSLLSVSKNCCITCFLVGGLLRLRPKDLIAFWSEYAIIYVYVLCV